MNIIDSAVQKRIDEKIKNAHAALDRPSYTRKKPGKPKENWTSDINGHTIMSEAGKVAAADAKKAESTKKAYHTKNSVYERGIPTRAMPKFRTKTY